jgi:hypothetical protein
MQRAMLDLIAVGLKSPNASPQRKPPTQANSTNKARGLDMIQIYPSANADPYCYSNPMSINRRGVRAPCSATCSPQ